MKAYRRSIRYLVVGALAFVVDYGTTWSLLSFFPLLIANSLGFIVANLFNFLASHRWVFGAAYSRDTLLSAYISVLGVSVVGLLINDAVMWAVVGLAGLPLLAGKVVATGVGLLWNYIARMKWIYKN